MPPLMMLNMLTVPTRASASEQIDAGYIMMLGWLWKKYEYFQVLTMLTVPQKILNLFLKQKYVKLN